MEVKLHLNVKANEFFDLIINSLVYDVENSTQQKINKEDIKAGYEYKKVLTNKIGNKGTANVKITQLNYPTDYAISFFTKHGENTISYNIVEEDEGIEITYQEKYIASKKSKEINHKVMSFFYDRGNKKRIQQLLFNMERYILESQSDQA